MKKILLTLLILTAGVSQAQEKVKGNREPSTVITDIDSFSTIEIGSDYEVAIVEGANAQVEITTDSNLHQYLEVDVINGNLSISCSAKIRSKKEMTIRLVYPSSLNKIVAKDKAEISTVAEIKSNQLEIEARDNAKLFLTANIDKLTLNLEGDSKSELNLTGNEATINLTDKASAKALIKYSDIDLTMKGRTQAKIEGDIEMGILSLENKAGFKGENLVFNTLNLKTSQNTGCEVNVKEELTLAASDNSKVELYNTPTVTLEKFTGKTQLIKK